MESGPSMIKKLYQLTIVLFLIYVVTKIETGPTVEDMIELFTDRVAERVADIIYVDLGPFD